MKIVSILKNLPTTKHFDKRGTRTLAKTDGYIRNQNMYLKQVRINILLKILFVLVPTAILIAVLWSIVSINPPPEKWEHTKITYSNISRERLSKGGTSYVLNAVGGERYILPIGTKKFEQLSQQLIPYEQYNIVYCENAFTKITKSLSSENEEFIELNISVTEWEKDRQIFYIVVAVMLLVMVVGSVLSYCLGCKKERQQIAKLKSKIFKRLIRNNKQPH